MPPQTKASRIRAYLDSHPDATDSEVATALGVERGNVQQARGRRAAAGRPATREASYVSLRIAPDALPSSVYRRALGMANRQGVPVSAVLIKAIRAGLGS